MKQRCILKFYYLTERLHPDWRWYLFPYIKSLIEDYVRIKVDEDTKSILTNSNTQKMQRKAINILPQLKKLLKLSNPVPVAVVSAPKVLDKESVYLLQCIDCNCNDCKHMDRDFDRYKVQQQYDIDNAKREYENRKAALLKNPNTVAEAKKLKYVAPAKPLIQYGFCTKKICNVSFIPGICQPDTQNCFEHRRAAPIDDKTPR